MYQITTLDNGLKIITREHKDALTCYLKVNVLAGSYFSPPGKEGLSHFLEHMIMNGTKTYPRSVELHQAFERLGGSVNAVTGKTSAAYFTKVREESWEEAAKLLFSLVSKPLLDEKELGAEKKIIAEEIARSEDTLARKVYDSLMKAMFQENSLSQPGLGYVNTINSFTISNVKDFYRKRYRPQNTVIYAAGKLSHEKLVGLVHDLFPENNTPGKRLSVLKLKLPKTSGPAVSVVKDPAKQARLIFAFPFLVEDENDYIMLNMLAFIMRGGKRLRHRLREKEHLAYDVDSRLLSNGNLQVFYVYGGFNYKKADLALKAICEELSKLKEESVSGEELDLAKKRMESRLLFKLERPSGWGSFASGVDSVLGKPLSIEEYKKLIEQINPEDINGLARELFVPEKSFLAVSHKPSSKEEFESILREGLS